MTKCLSETNGFIFLNPGHSTVSLCSSGPQGFRQLTKHILLLLCCLPTMLFTYRRMGGSVQQMNETAWISLTEPIEKFNCSCWSCPKFKFLMIQVPVKDFHMLCSASLHTKVQSDIIKDFHCTKNILPYIPQLVAITPLLSSSASGVKPHLPHTTLN